jgi:DNA-directed RNA polymerase specialized sigma24 family protein
MSESVSSEVASDSEPIDIELLTRTEVALLTLPRFTRNVFLAHRIDDLSYAEIARRTGTSVARVEREMMRALYGFGRAMDGNPLRWWERWR